MHTLKAEILFLLFSSICSAVYAQDEAVVLRCRFIPPVPSSGEMLLQISKVNGKLQSTIDGKLEHDNVTIEDEEISDDFHGSVVAMSLDMAGLSESKREFSVFILSNEAAKVAESARVNLGGISVAPFDLALVRKIRIYKISREVSKFGSLKFIEAADKSGSLLGKGIFLLFFSACKP